MELDPVALLDEYKNLTPDNSEEGREAPIRSDLEAEMAAMQNEPDIEADKNLTRGEIDGQQMQETSDDVTANEADTETKPEEKKLKVKIDGKVEEVSESEIPEEERSLEAKQMIIAANRKMQDVAAREAEATVREQKILETSNQLNDFMERAKQDVFAALEHVGYSREDLERSAARILKERIDRDALPPEEKVRIQANAETAKATARAESAEAQLREAHNAQYKVRLETLVGSELAEKSVEDKPITRNILSRYLIDKYHAEYNGRDSEFEKALPSLIGEGVQYIITEVPSLKKATGKPPTAKASSGDEKETAAKPAQAPGKRAKSISEAMETGNFTGLEDKIFDIMKR